MPVRTVNGVLNADNLGVISPHEHVLIDIRNQFSEFSAISERVRSQEPVQMSNLDALSRNPYAVKDNLVLGDIEIQQKELSRFKEAGGDTVVDATSIGIGRDPLALLRISRATGIHIIAGCGYYTADTHPPDMDGKTVDQIRQEILDDLQQGMDGTQIRAGVIGEIGTSEPIHPNEEKVLKAAADAHVETGVGVIVHTYPWGKQGLEAVRILTGRGVPPHKISINHIDVEIDLDYCQELTRTGVFIEFDDFGKEFFIDKRHRGFAGGVFARDIERVKALRQLIAAGFLENLLMSCDVCLKTLLHSYGGWGYDHILTNVVPMMLDEGITSAQVDVLLKDNPRRFLDVPA